MPYEVFGNCLLRQAERLAEWLPNFSGYADSVLAKLLPRHPAPEGKTEVAKALSPQVKRVTPLSKS